jgi:hypothetical protein
MMYATPVFGGGIAHFTSGRIGVPLDARRRARQDHGTAATTIDQVGDGSTARVPDPTKVDVDDVTGSLLAEISVIVEAQGGDTGIGHH